MIMAGFYNNGYKSPLNSIKLFNFNHSFPDHISIPRILVDFRTNFIKGNLSKSNFSLFVYPPQSRCPASWTQFTDSLY
ncbi:hypothetical protein C0J52_17546 [Blattella germanica]|nr:hypothetical protein C0J52_17546 [Blattella germanica]